MTIDNAQSMIRRYGEILQKTAPPAIFMSKSTLPCSVAKMKFAIMRYVTELNRREQLTPDQIENMIVAYSYLAFFVDDDLVNNLNVIMLQKDDVGAHSSKLKRKYKGTIHDITIQKERLIREIKEYILECKDYIKN